MYVSYVLYYTVRPRKKRKPINQVTLSENCNELSENVYIVSELSLSSLFCHQLQGVLAIRGQPRIMVMSKLICAE